jgi:hypothetical protein
MDPRRRIAAAGDPSHACPEARKRVMHHPIAQRRRPIGDQERRKMSISDTPPPTCRILRHGLCNGYRWAYSPEEFQWALKIGVWARRQMEKQSALGNAMLQRFYAYERKRDARRRVRQS